MLPDVEDVDVGNNRLTGETNAGSGDALADGAAVTDWTTNEIRTATTDAGMATRDVTCIVEGCVSMGELGETRALEMIILIWEVIVWGEMMFKPKRKLIFACPGLGLLLGALE